MNTIQQIIANAIDLAGGQYIEKIIDVGQTTLYALNQVADMELELNESERGKNARSQTVTLPAARTGTLDFVPRYARFQDTRFVTGLLFNRWCEMPVVGDIEALTQAENQGRLAILVQQFSSESYPAFPYRLSFMPWGNLEIEFFGSSEQSIPELSGTPSINMDYAHFAAVKVALLVLDDLLLINPEKYNIFVQNRKVGLMPRLKMLQHRWNVYRTNANINEASNQSRAYDPNDDDNFRNYPNGNQIYPFW